MMQGFPIYKKLSILYVCKKDVALLWKVIVGEEFKPRFSITLSCKGYHDSKVAMLCTLGLWTIKSLFGRIPFYKYIGISVMCHPNLLSSLEKIYYSHEVF